MIRRPPRSTLSLHDALPIWRRAVQQPGLFVHSPASRRDGDGQYPDARRREPRSEEHTSELQSQSNLVCRLLLEKKKKRNPSSKILIITLSKTRSPLHVAHND